MTTETKKTTLAWLLLVALAAVLLAATGCGNQYLCGAIVETRADGVYKYSRYTDKWVKLADGSYGNSQCVFTVEGGQITKVTNK